MEKKTKIKPDTLIKIIDLRERLAPIGTISFLISKLSKDYPLDFIDEETAQEVIKQYEYLIERAKNLKIK